MSHLDSAANSTHARMHACTHARTHSVYCRPWSWESCIPRCSSPAYSQNQVPTHTVLCHWSVSN